MKKTRATLKPYLRWLILGATLFFLLGAFKEHWREVASLRIERQGWLMLAIALLVTIVAHVWSGWVWTWILNLFQQPLKGWQALRVYLMTNLAKYLPGNVWHFSGRIWAVSQAGGSLGIASLSVLLEPLLMAAAALLVALVCGGIGWLGTMSSSQWSLPVLGLAAVLLGVHPRLLNPLIRRLSRAKAKVAVVDNVYLKQYPLLPLLGELGFLLLRGSGFLLTLMALMSINPSMVPRLFGVFSFAWLLGLIVPGAPGGLGVFEATAIALLGEEPLPTGVMLSGVALFRIVSILAESIAAGAAWLCERRL